MSSSYKKFSGVCGILTGLAGLLYLAAFIALKNPAAMLPAISLLVFGFLASATLVALYLWVREVDEGFALLGLLLGVGGEGGAAVHAAFDVSNNLHPPATAFAYASLVDPRGFLSFAVAGLATILIGWLIVRRKTLPGMAGYLGILSGILLVLLYVVYLTLLDPSNPAVLFSVIASGIVQPIWYLWIGWSLLRGKERAHKKATTKRSR